MLLNVETVASFDLNLCGKTANFYATSSFKST